MAVGRDYVVFEHGEHLPNGGLVLANGCRDEIVDQLVVFKDHGWVMKLYRDVLPDDRE